LAARDVCYWIEIIGHVNDVQAFTIFAVMRDHLGKPLGLLVAQIVQFRRVILDVKQLPDSRALNTRLLQPAP